MDLARTGNKYLTDTEPWHLIKTDQTRVQTILNLSLQIAANLLILGEPFLPYSSRKINEILNIESYNWSDAGSVDLLPSGKKLGPAILIFEKIEDQKIEEQIEKLKNTRNMNESQSDPDLGKSEINYEDFAKLDIRIGTVVEAEKVEKSKKLLKIRINTGIDQRTIVSGIAEYFSPDQVLGKQVSILINLAPRKIMGIESQGMILMAEDHDGSLKFIEPSAKVEEGAIIS